MTDGLSMDVDLRGFNRNIAALAGRIEDFEPVAEDFGAHMVHSWEVKFPRTPAGVSSPPGGPPAIGAGDMAASLTYEVGAGGDQVEVGTPLRYGAIQHYGGTIRPVHAKALTVPIHPRARGRRARDFYGLFRIPAKPGQEPEDLGILALKGPGDTIIPMFALRTKVTLPARPWRIIYPDDETYLERRMAQHLELN